MFPDHAVFSTWICTKLRDGVSLDDVYLLLATADWNVDSMFFPVHHVSASHWACVHVKWNGLSWEVRYYDSLDDGTRGTFYVNAICDLLHAYFASFKKATPLPVTGGRRRVGARITDVRLFGRKAEATILVVINPDRLHQVDGFNCGSFVLILIESTMSSFNFLDIPTSSEWMQRYRNRILLSLCGARLSRS